MPLPAHARLQAAQSFVRDVRASGDFMRQQDAATADARYARLLAQLAEEAGVAEDVGEIVEDEVPEPPDEAITKSGDLWILGDHRLLCGDSSKARERLEWKPRVDFQTLVKMMVEHDMELAKQEATLKAAGHEVGLRQLKNS